MEFGKAELRQSFKDDEGGEKVIAVHIPWLCRFGCCYVFIHSFYFYSSFLFPSCVFFMIRVGLCGL